MAEAALAEEAPPEPAKAEPARTDQSRTEGPLADALNDGPVPRGDPNRGPSILDIAVEVQFVLGHAKVSVGTLMDMAAAHVLRMDRAPGDPVDVVVNGTRVAEGELVGEEDDGDGGLGVRITRIFDAPPKGSHDG